MELREASSVFFFGVFIGMVLVMNVPAHWTRHYEKGQIDALTGTVRYELREQEDKTVRWEAIPGM